MAKSSAQSSERVYVPQPHGGALVPGAGGGRQPGAGRPPSEIRRKLRGDLADIRDEIAELRQNREKCPTCKRQFKDADLIRLADFYAKYSVGAAKGYDEALVEALGNDLVAVLQDELSEEVAHRVWERARQSWVTTIGLHVRGE